MSQVTSGDLREGSRKRGFLPNWMLLKRGDNSLFAYSNKSYPERYICNCTNHEAAMSHINEEERTYGHFCGLDNFYVSLHAKT